MIKCDIHIVGDLEGQPDCSIVSSIQCLATGRVAREDSNACRVINLD